EHPFGEDLLVEEGNRRRRPPSRVLPLEDQDVERPYVTERLELEHRTGAHPFIRSAEVFADPCPPCGLVVLHHVRREPHRRGLLVGQDGNFGVPLKAREESLARAAVEREDDGVVPLEPGARERPLDRARLRNHLDVLGADLSHHEAPDSKEERIARRENANLMLLGEAGDVVEGGRDPVPEDDAVAPQVGEELELALATDEHPCLSDRVARPTGEAPAPIVADADDRHRASVTHGCCSAARERRAWIIAPATGLPPFRPRVTMNGVLRLSTASFDVAAATKPTGTPRTSAGRASSSHARRTTSSSAVGAFPIATTAPSS